ncbi:MAG: hypothetical protein RLZZ383_2283 [Pseudomonadota bacterium]
MTSWRAVARATSTWLRLRLQGAGDDDAARQRALWALYEGFAGQFPDVATVDPVALCADLRAGVPWVVVDVRGEAERAVSTLPEAISLDALTAGGAAYRGRPVVVYCTLGYRSATAARALAGQGWQVSNLAGGALAWTHAGGGLWADGVSVDALHVYGSSYNVAASWVRGVW